MDRRARFPLLPGPPPGPAAGHPGAVQDLLDLELLPLDLAGRFPALRQDPPCDPRRRQRAGRPDLMVVGPGGLTRLARAAAEDK